MNAFDDYAKQWVKHENEELDTLSVWDKGMRGILGSRFRNIKTKVRTIYPSVFSKPEVRIEKERLHDEFALVPARNNIVFDSKAHYYNCILKGLHHNVLVNANLF
jgi:hypothetical protein